MNNARAVYELVTNLDCNLACSYCYERENPSSIRRVNSLSNCKKFLNAIYYKDYSIDQISTIDNPMTLRLIGGESFLYPRLLDDICSEMEKLDFKYNLTSPFRINISTNGTLLTNPLQRKFLERWKDHLTIGFSIDGTKEIHNLARVDSKGNGSYDKAIEGLRVVQSILPPDKIYVKSTFTHKTIHNYYESIVNLVSLGFTRISANTVYDEIWSEEDLGLCTEQLFKVVDYIVYNDLVDKISFFQLYPNSLDPSLFNPIERRTCNWCGSCKSMICLGLDGLLYGCHRFASTSSSLYPIGYIDSNNSIVLNNKKLISTVENLYKEWPKECQSCSFNKFCASCAHTAYEYNSQSPNLIFNSKPQCAWTKALVAARMYLKDQLLRKDEEKHMSDEKAKRVGKIPTTIQILTNMDCNLDCKYCYEHSKGHGPNDIEHIKEYLDCMLRATDKTQDRIIVDFIGGESFLYPDLLDEACDYTMELIKKYNLSNNVIFSFSTNGTLITSSPKLQEFIKKWKFHLHIGFSIDGPKYIHDAARVNKQGDGSYDKAVEGFRWVRQNVPCCNVSAKATFSHTTIQHYAEAVIHLIELGFTEIAANVVFEETWPPAEADMIATQIFKIIDYLFDHNLQEKVYIFHLNPAGLDLRKFQITGHRENRNFCGSCTYMRTLGFDGLIYGCQRFATMSNPKPIGYLKDGEIVITQEGAKLILDVSTQWMRWSDDCKKCALLSQCSSCAAIPYELYPDNPDIYLQLKTTCAFTKACAASRLYFRDRLLGQPPIEHPEMLEEDLKQLDESPKAIKPTKRSWLSRMIGWFKPSPSPEAAAKADVKEVKE